MTGVTLRRWAPALLGFGLAGLLAFAALVALARSRAAAAGVTYGVPAPVRLAADKGLGVNADLSHLDPASRERALAEMEEAGVRWLRTRFPWDAIEPERGVFDWGLWDAIVEAATRHNLRLIAVLDGSPSWARATEDASNPLAPPSEAREYGAYVATFATRYGAQIDHYQVWDEPNISPHWGSREVDPQQYGQLLREGAIQVRAADHGAIVLLAALAPNVEPGGANMSELAFLDALYALGADEWFDLVAGQLYDFVTPVDAPASPDSLNWRRAGMLRDMMVAHGDSGTAVWAVSFGLSEGDEGVSYGGAGDAVTQAVLSARQDWPWLGPMLWAAWSPEDPHGEYALATPHGQRGAAYDALDALARSAPVAWPGIYAADHPSGTYDGGWRVTPDGADIGRTGDRLAIPFWGTRLDLEARRGPYRAFLFVSVDGRAANALPQDSEGRAYLVLYDPLLGTENTTLARDLPEGYHLAEIVAERGWGQWAVAGWTSSREAGYTGLWLPVILGLAALLAFGTSAAWTWPRRHELAEEARLAVAHYRVADDRLALAITLAAAILVFAVVGTVPSLVSLGILFLLLLLRPEMGLPLIALVLPFYQLGKPLLGKVFSMVEILTLLTGAAWLLDRVLLGRRCAMPQRESLWRYSAIDVGVIALVVVGALSLVWADEARVAVREYRTVVLEAALFYALLRLMVADRCGVWRVADAWILGGLAISLVGLYQWAFGQNLITADGIWRVRGFYGSPNNLALYLVRLFPLCLAIGAWGRRGIRRWLYAITALVVAGALILTYSRGAWLLGVPISVLFLAALRGWRILAAVTGLLVLAGLVAVGVAGPARLTTLLDTSQGTTFFRLQLWRSSWAMIRDHPVLGVGLDNFLYQYRSRYVLPTAWEEFNLSHPHNILLDFWLRLGLPGLLVLVWLLVTFFRQGFRSLRRLARGVVHRRLLVMGLMAGMVGAIAHGLVDNAFFLVDLAFVFMLMLALIQAVDTHGPAASADVL